MNASKVPATKKAIGKTETSQKDNAHFSLLLARGLSVIGSACAAFSERHY